MRSANSVIFWQRNRKEFKFHHEECTYDLLADLSIIIDIDNQHTIFMYF